MSLICSGSWFHRVGAATLKALSANVLHFVLGITSKFELFDLAFCVEAMSSGNPDQFQQDTYVLV